MGISMKKLWHDYGIGVLLMLIVVAYVGSTFGSYLTSKGSTGYELNQGMQPQYKGNQVSSVTPSQPLGQNEVFADASNMKTSMGGVPSSFSKPTISNPTELLPKDTNTEWAQLNPAGKGELANVSLLKAGQHIGVNTVGQSNRNANLQIRSEPPNPQTTQSPWNNTTMEPDAMRPPLEIGGNCQ
jgi:hypothetical protein